MSELVSERTRAVLAQSLPIVRQHRDEMVGAMELYLRRIGDGRRTFGRSDVTAMILTDLLLRQAGLIAETGRAAGLETLAREHEAVGIDGRHYSRFGDALVPVLRDSLGPNLPREVSSAWSDTFWAVIRAAQAKVERQERGQARSALATGAALGDRRAASSGMGAAR